MKGAADGRLSKVRTQNQKTLRSEKQIEHFGQIGIQEEQVIADLIEFIESSATPSDLIRRLVDRLDDPADRWSDHPLRVRILKRFIKYGNYLTSHGYTSRMTLRRMVEQKTGRKPDLSLVLRTVDDSFFDVLEHANHEQKKRNGAYGLLKAADDLAAGVIHSQNGSITPLYLFGICYDMRFGAVSPDADHDFEGRIFHDLYANHLLHFFMDVTVDQDATDLSGRGINYKNPYELIYLYWMNQEIPTDQKVESAGKMIQRLKNAAKEKKTNRHTDKVSAAKPTKIRTLKARQAVSPRHGMESILHLDQEAFFQILLTRYPLEARGGAGIMNVDLAQNTAWKVYRKVRRNFFSLLEENSVSIVENCYGLWFSSLDIDSKDPAVHRFRSVIKKVNTYLGHTVSIPGDSIWTDRMEDDESVLIGYIRHALRSEISACTDPASRKEMEATLADSGSLAEQRMQLMERLVEKDRKLPYIYRVNGAENVTRVRLLGLLYYEYNLRKDMAFAIGQPVTLRQVYTEFKTFVDPYLMAAFYPLLSMDILFDSLLVCLSFLRNSI